jgi:hypothetical protein
MTNVSQAWWHTPIIPGLTSIILAIQESEIRRIPVQGQFGRLNLKKKDWWSDSWYSP